jgi:purine-binding chemotaxis protein CheW
MSTQIEQFSDPKSSYNPDRLALLTFTVAEQTYGLPVYQVVRIIEMVTITQLPGVPDFIQGIINLGGKAVPVIDLRRRFGLPQQAYGLHTPIILAEMDGGRRIIGLIVDTVKQVLEIAGGEMEIAEAIVPPELVHSMTSDTAHLAGVAKVDRHIILVLNAPALLSPTDKIGLAKRLADEGARLTTHPGLGDIG